MGKREHLIDGTILVVLVVLFLNLLLCDGDASGFFQSEADEYTIPFVNGWSYADDEGAQEDLSFPFLHSTAHIEGTASIKNILPEVTDKDVMILFDQTQSICVYVGKECVFESGMDELTKEPDLLGKKVLYVPLKAAYSGKEIRIELYPGQTQRTLQIKNIYLCAAGEFEIIYIRKHFALLLFLSIFFILGIGLILAYGMQRLKRTEYDYSIFLHLGMFVILCAVWMSTDALLLQILTQSPVICAIISFCTFMLLPVPLLAFTYSITEQKYPVLQILEFGLCVNCILQMVLQMTGVKTFPEMLIYTHCLYLLTMGIVFMVLKKARKQHKSYYVSGMIVAMWLLATFGLATLICYYVNVRLQYLSIMEAGVFLFVGILGWLTIRRWMRFWKEDTEEKVYLKIAYQDVMTELRNRRGFEEDLQVFEQHRQREDIIIIELDVNNLKEVNDQYGHLAGDEILKATANCMTHAFHKEDRLYRIGGDEFVVITLKPEKQVIRRLEVFEKSAEEYSRTSKYGLTVAKGYALVRDEPTATLEEILRTADKRMYENKANMKQDQKDSENSIS